MSKDVNEYAKSVRVTLEKLPSSHYWSWEVNVDGDSVYGDGEPDYCNAENMVQDTLREMGVDA